MSMKLTAPARVKIVLMLPQFSVAVHDHRCTLWREPVLRRTVSLVYTSDERRTYLVGITADARNAFDSKIERK